MIKEKLVKLQDPIKYLQSLQRTHDYRNQGGNQMVTYNDFFYNMLQAGEVAEITIFPGEDRENRALILLKQGAMYKVSESLC